MPLGMHWAPDVLTHAVGPQLAEHLPLTGEPHVHCHHGGEMSPQGRQLRGSEHRHTVSCGKTPPGQKANKMTTKTHDHKI